MVSIDKWGANIMFRYRSVALGRTLQYFLVLVQCDTFMEWDSALDYLNVRLEPAVPVLVSKPLVRASLCSELNVLSIVMAAEHGHSMADLLRFRSSNRTDSSSIVQTAYRSSLLRLEDRVRTYWNRYQRSWQLVRLSLAYHHVALGLYRSLPDSV